MTTITRRSALVGLASLSLLGSRLALASAATDRRFVLVILRGGLDGLHAIPAHGDPSYGAARGRMALPGPDVADGVIDLDGTFGLHPALGALLPLWEARQLTVVHAVASPYRERSHFDGQDLLENGTDRPHGARDGWLNRALVGLGGEAMALGKAVPLVLRGAADVASWDPGGALEPDDDLIDAVASLYAGDALLARSLAEGRATRELVADMEMGRSRGRRALPVAALTSLLSQETGPRIAVLEAGGWDSHTGQGGVRGGLAGRLSALGEGLAGLPAGLGEVWDRTVVLVVTEFGRTVGGNGTGGTDHGTGTVALLAGGAVAGGRVIADWPGLAARELYQGRDLRPTTDLRSVFKGVLADHLGVARRELDGTVFPESRDVAAMGDLIA